MTVVVRSAVDVRTAQSPAPRLVGLAVRAPPQVVRVPAVPAALALHAEVVEALHQLRRIAQLCIAAVLLCPYLTLFIRGGAQMFPKQSLSTKMDCI